MSIIWCIGIGLLGYGIANMVFHKNQTILFSMAFPFGAMSYLLVRMSTHSFAEPWAVFLPALLIAVCCYWLAGFAPPCDTDVKLDRGDYALIAANAVVWWVHLRQFVGYDTLNHFFFAAQIQRGILPPCGFAFSDYPAKYHYGWDILLADLSKIGNFSYADTEDILSILFLVSNSVALLYLLKKLIGSRGWYYAGFLVFWFGTGVLGILNHGQYLSLFSMYNQHAWCFTVSVLLFCLLWLANFPRKKYWYCYIATFLIGGAASLYSAHSVVLLGIFLAFGGAYVLFGREKRDWLAFAGFGCTGIALLGIWKLTNWGILVSGEIYDNPVYRLSAVLLGWKNYLRYMGGYVLMIPVAWLMWSLCIQVFWRERFAVLQNYSPALVFGGVCAVCLVPLPFVGMIENSAYWDNFCKFNYIGVLCGWILGGYALWRMASKHKRLGVWLSGIVVGAVLLVSSYNAVGAMFLSKAAAEPDRMTELTKQMKVLPYGAILLLNPELHEHYTVERQTNKAQVNLYGYVATYFGRFVFLATELGLPVLNFYDYNFMYDRTAEYRQLDALDRLYHGEAEALNSLNIAYCITPWQRWAMLDEAEKQGRLRKIAANQSENWTLFEVHHQPYENKEQ